MTTATRVPSCPRCGGDMFDNRGDKKSPKHPDFRCKDKNCVDPDSGYRTALWVEDLDATDQPLPTKDELESGMPNVGGTGPGKPKNPADNFDVMAFKHAIDDVKRLREYANKGEHGWEVPPDAASRWVTSIFIQRSGR